MFWGSGKSTSCASRLWGKPPAPSAVFYDPVIPGPFLAPSLSARLFQPTPTLCIPNEPPIALNPQLKHHRSQLHPYLDWNVADSPLAAKLQHGSAHFMIGSFHLEQYATLPPVKSLSLTLGDGTAASLSSWSTVHVERTDGRPLRVGDVLNAIHIHLKRRLKRDDIQGMDVDRWERVLQAFNRRVSGRKRGRMQRLDFLDGQTLFDGIQFVGGELRLALEHADRGSVSSSGALG